MRAIAIIPARYDSSRFPGKPLALLGGEPMLRHVFEHVYECKLFERVMIATDDFRIAEAAESWNAPVMMTARNHVSGTDRCAEVMDNMPGEYDIVVNIQGDEPFISREPLAQLLSIFQSHPSAGIATLVHRIDDPHDITDENTAKVVLATAPYLHALYFSRSPVPFVRSCDPADWASRHIFWKHIGLYAYRPAVLKQIVQLPVGNLERAESLEQLRWLENGFEIAVAETDYKMLSVDTPADLERAQKFYNTRSDFYTIN